MTEPGAAWELLPQAMSEVPNEPAGTKPLLDKVVPQPTVVAVRVLALMPPMKGLKPVKFLPLTVTMVT